ncbi:hypothetical protein L6304_05500, partial [bacterium]|nr:hypothetical protein [bacterium]
RRRKRLKKRRKLSNTELSSNGCPSLRSGYLAKVPLWDLADPIGIERKYPEPTARGGCEARFGYR